jgi:hypothetical protein
MRVEGQEYAMRKTSTWILTGAVAAVMAGTLSLARANSTDDAEASNPSTQPTTRPDRRGDDSRNWRDRHGGFMLGRSPDGYRNEELPSDEEWDEIVEFMKANSPVRLEMYDKVVETFKGSNSDRPINGARRRIAGRYRDLMTMKERHPDMFEFALKQTVLEDQILGTMREIRDGGENEARAGKFRDLVTAYVDNFLNEREARLKKLREMVERETKTIDKDRASMDELIQKQSERFEKEMSRLLDFWEDPDKFKPQSPANP